MVTAVTASEGRKGASKKIKGANSTPIVQSSFKIGIIEDEEFQMKTFDEGKMISIISKMSMIMMMMMMMMIMIMMIIVMMMMMMMMVVVVVMMIVIVIVTVMIMIAMMMMMMIQMMMI